jgi:hypothetical protein
VPRAPKVQKAERPSSEASRRSRDISDDQKSREREQRGQRAGKHDANRDLNEVQATTSSAAGHYSSAVRWIPISRGLRPSWSRWHCISGIRKSASRIRQAAARCGQVSSGFGIGHSAAAQSGKALGRPVSWPLRFTRTDDRVTPPVSVPQPCGASGISSLQHAILRAQKVNICAESKSVRYLT